MRPYLLALALSLAAAPASAQPAAALGHPLPAADLSVGTVSVRVIAGNPQNPVVGTEVTLVVNGTPRIARTDSGGRAFFKDLPAGATVQAKIVDDDKKDVTSDQFPVPDSGGTKVMLTTRPMAGGMGGAPFAGGAGGAGGAMPEPRKLSGQPRPESADPVGTYTVRLTYNDLKDASPPAGITVALAAYSADDSVKVTLQKTDASGRVQFTGLDTSGATSYFAMVNLPRAGATDRLLAQPIVMLPDAGVRVILSSEKRDAQAPAIDDLAAGEPPTAAGKIRVTLDGVPDVNAEVVLVDAATHTVIGTAKIGEGPPDMQALSGGAPFETRPDLPAGTLAIDAHGGPGNALDPLPHVGVRVFPADKDGPADDAPAAETDASGVAKLEQLPTGPLRSVITINGRDFVNEPFDLTKTGGAVHITAQWDTTGKPEATFDYLPRADQVVYAETKMRGQLYRSRPFLAVPERGVHIGMRILPRLLFNFSLTSHVEDQFLAVQGRLELFNNSWAPYFAGKDGIVLPLPSGFKNAQVAEQDQSEVIVDPGKGFRLVRPIPPGGRRFIGGWLLPVEDGKIEWSLDLPLGTYQSGVEIKDFPGMSLSLGGNMTSETATDTRGTWRVLPRITILPNQSMQMTISGLPAAPGWTVWVPRVLGIVVVATMLAGIAIALVRRSRASDAARAVRRQQLLDELVELDRGDPKDRDAKQTERRDAVLAELEQLWP